MLLSKFILIYSQKRLKKKNFNSRKWSNISSESLKNGISEEFGEGNGGRYNDTKLRFYNIQLHKIPEDEKQLPAKVFHLFINNEKN